ncbi:methyltransferase small domain-containing protein [Pseudomassariella vexata]|uniref:Methyltransferase small domain-containing protein n=1 Tax=Pseudomassariella vexata TaxID=1141098 RepID=A0A1Y2E3S4_9PEZI|nr:methyltransferase small domain-containing protein [Pseudomassariella vexata]ORY66097.1 methyltransferase small domain-containing protein [Pseudomassariella vexata]
MSSADPSFSSIKYVPTTEAYNRWAKVYDTDGNFLQALDNIEMQHLMPRFISSIRSPKPWRMADLGCGTGRNTALLLIVEDAHIAALDSSDGMLEVAKARLKEFNAETPAEADAKSRSDVQFELFDLLASSDPPAHAKDADGIISTLVIEHIPLPAFFSKVTMMLKTDGVLLLTNMHSHMGGISQAGFVDPNTGEKIRPTSYAHTVEDVVAEAAKWGLELEGDRGMVERAVDDEMVGKLGPRSQKWVGITCWFGGLFRKKY